ncbi:tetratricopeptide repeat protein [Elusimicrobiota bacterium]
MNSIKKITVIAFSAFLTCSLVFCGDAWAGKKKKAKQAFEEAHGRVGKGYYDAAATLFWKAYQYDPKNINALIYAGKSYFLAASKCKKCLESVKKSNYDSAISTLKEAIEKVPANGLPHLFLGEVYYELEKDNEAIEAFTKAVELKVEWDSQFGKVTQMDAHHYLGRSLYFAGKYDSALKQLQAVLQNIETFKNKCAKDPWPDACKQSVEWDMKKYREYSLQEIRNKYGNFDHIYNYRVNFWYLGNVYKRKGDLKKAREYYQEAANLGISLGHKYLSKLDFEECEALAKKNKGKPLPAMTAEVRKYLVQGQALRKAKKYDKAIEKLSEAIKLEPSTPSAYYNIGLVYGAMENYPLAINKMKCFRSLDPNHAQAQKAQDKISEWEALSEE